MAMINARLDQVKEEDMNRQGGGWTVKPDGWYRVLIQESSFKYNEKGTGSLFLKHIHLDPPYESSAEHEYLSIECPSSDKAQTISLAKLKEIAVAVGHPTPDIVVDSDALHGIPFMIRLYSERDERNKYADANGMVQRIGGHMGIAAWRQEHGGQAATNPPIRPDQVPYGGRPKVDVPPVGDDDIPF